MNKNDLLKDVFADSAPLAFREVLLSETLRQARHRQQVRKTNHALLVSAVAFVLAAILWEALPRRHRPESIVAKVQPTDAHGVRVVRTQPLALALVIKTEPGFANVVSSSPTDVVLLESRPGPDLYAELNDEQLLGLFDEGRAALVRHGPHQAELVFVEAKAPSPEGVQ
jgi:hypothetical protein